MNNEVEIDEIYVVTEATIILSIKINNYETTGLNKNTDEFTINDKINKREFFLLINPLKIFKYMKIKIKKLKMKIKLIKILNKIKNQ